MRQSTITRELADSVTLRALQDYFRIACHTDIRASRQYFVGLSYGLKHCRGPYRCDRWDQRRMAVVALAAVNGEGPAPVLPSPKTLNFSGYEWTTSTGPIFRAGARNFFDPANVWTDEGGALHLRISGSPGKWTAAEVKLTRSLGYGTYRFQLRDASHLEPSAVLTLVTWDGFGTESNRRGLNVELGRWGYFDNTDVNYVVQPYYVPANFVAFRSPPGAYTHSFRWEPGKVTFTTVAGSGNTTGGRVINQHVFTSGVPSPGGESVRIALYVFYRGHIPLKDENEVIVDKFEYLP